MLCFTLYLYLAVSTIYFLVFAIAGSCRKETRFNIEQHKKKIAILIPAYREDHIIIHTVKEACAHNYPREFFKVVVIADSLKNQTLDKLRLMPVQLVEVKFDISTKAKSLYTALQLLPGNQFDIAVILDADNVMANGFLETVNAAIQKGYQAIQCRRVAKNEDNPVALLGAVSEEININLFRRGQVALGFSAAPLGSAMAFEFTLIKDIFSRNNILESAAEDREIDIELLKRKTLMGFTDQAYVYDEKAANAAVFEKQRIRWFEAQWNNARRFFQKDMLNIPKTGAFFNKLFQTLVLPRLLYFSAYGLIFLVFAIQSFAGTLLVSPALKWWIACLLIYMFALIISIPVKYLSMKVLGAVFYIPILMFSMLKALFRMRKHRKEFIHTSKSYIESNHSD